MALSDIEKIEIQRSKNIAENYLYEFLTMMNIAGDIQYAKIVKKYTVVAGGLFASILNGENPKGIDIFFLDGMEEELSRNGLDSFFSCAIQQCKDRGLTFQNSSEYIKNPNVSEVLSLNQSKFQLIFSRFKTRLELLNDFDYKHCTISFHDGTLFTTEETFRAIKSKTLIPNNEKKLSQWRKEKFLSRGWTIPVVQSSGAVGSGVVQIPTATNGGAKVNVKTGTYVPSTATYEEDGVADIIKAWHTGAGNNGTSLTDFINEYLKTRTGRELDKLIGE